MKTILVAACIAGAAATAQAGWFEDCEHEAKREASVSFAGARSVRVLARAGSLDVRGVNGANAVRAHGTACASSESLLGKTQLQARRSGSEVVIEATMPDYVVGYGSFKLDFTVEVPAGVAITVDDSSGSMKIENVGSLTIDDSSGEIEVRGVRGALTVDDSSGEIDVADVTGVVRIDDSSGGILIRNVTGEVVIIEDSSGGIDVREVRGNVIVERDSSGGILVADVRGDFTVRRDGSGGIEHARVSGRVSLPGR
jgi:hypothetical protein